MTHAIVSHSLMMRDWRRCGYNQINNRIAGLYHAMREFLTGESKNAIRRDDVGYVLRCQNVMGWGAARRIR